MFYIINQTDQIFSISNTLNLNDAIEILLADMIHNHIFNIQNDLYILEVINTLIIGKYKYVHVNFVYETIKNKYYIITTENGIKLAEQYNSLSTSVKEPVKEPVKKTVKEPVKKSIDITLPHVDDITKDMCMIDTKMKELDEIEKQKEEEFAKLLQDYNLLKQEKTLHENKLEEQHRIYEVDKELYEKFKNKLLNTKLNKDEVIPTAFINKFNTFKQLENENMTTFENYQQLLQKFNNEKVVSTSYDYLFNDTGNDIYVRKNNEDDSSSDSSDDEIVEGNNEEKIFNDSDESDDEIIGGNNEEEIFDTSTNDVNTSCGNNQMPEEIDFEECVPTV